MGKLELLKGGLAERLDSALVQAGAEQHEIEHLVENERTMHNIVCLLRGDGLYLPKCGSGPVSLAAAPHGLIIDCSAKPFIPDGWEIRPEDQVKSAVSNRIEWNLKQLHLVDDQEFNGYTGWGIWLNLKGQPVLPAVVLDWLLERPSERIPILLKDMRIFFWGTVYRNKSGLACVRYLDTHDRSPVPCHELLDARCNISSMVAVWRSGSR